MIIYAITIACFVLFFYQNYTSNINVEYISLQSSSLCQKVPIPTTTTLLVDMKGKWNTQNGFDLTKAYYQIDYTNFNLKTSYKEEITKTRQSLRKPPNNYDLAMLILISMIYKQYTDTSKLQTIKLLGDPNVIYSINGYTTFTISSKYGICNLTPLIQATDTNLVIFYQYSYFKNNSICKLATYVDTTPFDYMTGTAIPNPNYNANFVFKINMNTFIVTVSLNLGLIDFSIISILGSEVEYLSYKGKYSVSYIYCFIYDMIVFIYTMNRTYCTNN